MELQVIEITFPQIIEFNYLELKKEIEEKVAVYAALSYAEDQIQDAKKDRAALNKFVKALSDERIKIKKECLKPYEDFEAKIKELDGIVNKAIQNIDGQVKGFEEQKKAEKQAAIEAYFENTNDFDWLKLKQIFNERWLNASVKLVNVTIEIDCAMEQIAKDLETLSNLPEFSFEAIEEYKQSLDLNKAITEGQRMSQIQKRKIEAEETAKVQSKVTSNVQVEETDAPRVWLSFKAHVTVDDANELRKFFNSRNIEFEAI